MWGCSIDLFVKTRNIWMGNNLTLDFGECLRSFSRISASNILGSAIVELTSLAMGSKPKVNHFAVKSLREMRKEIQQAGDLNDRYTEAHSKLEDFGVQQSYNFERIAKE